MSINIKIGIKKITEKVNIKISMKIIKINIR